MNIHTKGTLTLALLFFLTTFPLWIDHEPSAFKLRAAENTIRTPITQIWLRVEFDEETNRACLMGELRSDLFEKRASWYLGPPVR